jgi:2-polyprenyl-3-methyl-5-hydroxy-6-metoxy-1,4-benzoquinol methylase
MSEKKHDLNSEDFKYSGTHILAQHESLLEKYNSHIVNSFVKTLPKCRIPQNYKVLDFGAGIGTLADIFMNKYHIKPDLVEIDEIQIKILEEKKYTVKKNIEEFTAKYDFIYTSNVLEHITDDLETLIAINEQMKIDSTLAIYVPAFPILFSDLDRSVNHVRRYTKRDLTSKVQAAGFEVFYCSYVDCIGFFASLFIRIVGWQKQGNIGGGKSLEIYDRFLFPLSTKLDAMLFKFFLGKNLMLIAKKKF